MKLTEEPSLKILCRRLGIATVGKGGGEATVRRPTPGRLVTVRGMLILHSLAAPRP